MTKMRQVSDDAAARLDPVISCLVVSGCNEIAVLSDCIPHASTDRNELQKIFIFSTVMVTDFALISVVSLFSSRAERLAFPDSDGNHTDSVSLDAAAEPLLQPSPGGYCKSGQASKQASKQTKNYILFVYII